MGTRIQVRRDTKSNWESNNPTLLQGEYGRETNTGNYKVGDGTTPWLALAYENIIDNLSDVVVSTPASGQVLTYNGTNWINSTPSSGVTDHTLLTNIGTNTHTTIDSFISSKGVADGLAPLDSSGKVFATMLPDSVVGALEYKGGFDATQGYPANPETGWYYVCTTGGTISEVVYAAGDWAIYNGATWDHLNATDAVSSIDGQTGAINLSTSYISTFPTTAVQGDIVYRGASSWTRLGFDDAGKVLITGGSGANPSWSNIDGGSSSG